MQATFNWGSVISAFRAVAASNVKTDEGTMAYIKMQMRETDTFHDYYSMDNLYSVLKRDTHEVEYDDLMDAVYQAFEQVYITINAHFEDKWNFAPGYTQPAVACPEVYGKDEQTFHTIAEDFLKSVVPELFNGAKAHRDAEFARQAAAREARLAAEAIKKAARKAKRDAKKAAQAAQ